MKITAFVRIVAKAADPKNPRADKDGTLVLKPGMTDDVKDDQAQRLIAEGWAEKEGETERQAKRKAAQKAKGKSDVPSGRRRAANRPGAPAARSRADLIGEEMFEGSPKED